MIIHNFIYRHVGCLFFFLYMRYQILRDHLFIFCSRENISLKEKKKGLIFERSVKGSAWRFKERIEVIMDFFNVRVLCIEMTPNLFISRLKFPFRSNYNFTIINIKIPCKSLNYQENLLCVKV